MISCSVQLLKTKQKTCERLEGEQRHENVGDFCTIMHFWILGGPKSVSLSTASEFLLDSRCGVTSMRGHKVKLCKL